MNKYGKRVLEVLLLYLLGIALMLFMRLGSPIGIPLVFGTSALMWKYQECVSDWEMRAAYLTLGFIPVEYAFFVGTTGHLSRAQLFWSLVLALVSVAAALTDRNPLADEESLR